jgi:signal transduction histidine kinase
MQPTIRARGEYRQPPPPARNALNLVHNAADAVGDVHGAEIQLTCVGDRNSLHFQVIDNGIGVSPGRLEEVFVPFFTTKESGAGIGLTLARQIALAHGGQLSATRNAGPGMTFAFSITGQSR